MVSGDLSSLAMALRVTARKCWASKQVTQRSPACASAVTDVLRRRVIAVHSLDVSRVPWYRTPPAA